MLRWVFVLVPAARGRVCVTVKSSTRGIEKPRI
jgi:hypothetical protein